MSHKGFDRKLSAGVFTLAEASRRTVGTTCGIGTDPVYPRQERWRPCQRCGGAWVLCIDIAFLMSETVSRRNQLWMVPQPFRTALGSIDAHLIFALNGTITRGCVFFYLWLLVSRKELFQRMSSAELAPRSTNMLRDLDALTRATVENETKRILVRSFAQKVSRAIMPFPRSRFLVPIPHLEQHSL